jgi:hypothetical protein
MRKRSTSFGVRERRLAAAAAFVAAGWLMAGTAAIAQSAPPPEPPPIVQPAPKPSVFQSIGRWFDQAGSNFRDHLQGAKRKMDEVGDEAAANHREITSRAAEVGKGAAEVGKGMAEVGKGAAEATRSAVDAVAKLPTARVVQGRERCAVAPNGAPDCLMAAEALCRRSGYATGKSIDFTSAEQCPPRVMLGQAPRDQCETVTFISRAMCQ